MTNHTGTLKIGHYYTYAKNDEDKLWYEFDDEDIHAIKNLESVVNRDAYLLMYAKTSVDYFCR